MDLTKRVWQNEFDIWQNGFDKTGMNGNYNVVSVFNFFVPTSHRSLISLTSSFWPTSNIYYCFCAISEREHNAQFIISITENVVGRDVCKLSPYTLILFTHPTSLPIPVFYTLTTTVINESPRLHRIYHVYNTSVKYIGYSSYCWSWKIG